VTLVGPPELLPSGVEDWPVATSHDLDAVIDEGPDAIMMLRVQKERIKGDFPARVGRLCAELFAHVDRADRLPESSIVMHPGPMNRGVEIASDVADSSSLRDCGSGSQRRRGADGGSIRRVG
jgi:aspartate carbamoyltransferase catalytic subunit